MIRLEAGASIVKAIRIRIVLKILCGLKIRRLRMMWRQNHQVFRVNHRKKPSNSLRFATSG